MFFGKPKEALWVLDVVNREFPWLWALCQNWRLIHDVRVIQIDRTEVLDWEVGMDFSPGIPPVPPCFVHTDETVTMLKFPPGRVSYADILKSFREQGGDIEKVRHIATIHGGEGRIRVLRPKKGKAIVGFYAKYLEHGAR